MNGSPPRTPADRVPPATADVYAPIRSQMRRKMAEVVDPTIKAWPTRSLNVPGIGVTPVPILVGTAPGLLGPLPIQWPGGTGFIINVGVGVVSGDPADFNALQIQVTVGGNFDLFTLGQSPSPVAFARCVNAQGNPNPLFREYASQTQWQVKIFNLTTRATIIPFVWFDFVEDNPAPS